MKLISVKRLPSIVSSANNEAIS